MAKFIQLHDLSGRDLWVSSSKIDLLTVGSYELPVEFIQDNNLDPMLNEDSKGEAPISQLRPNTTMLVINGSVMPVLETLDQVLDALHTGYLPEREFGVR
jgi:hypothetical protein